MTSARPPAYVLLEDGTRFDGDACGADVHATGEVVFTTGMAGYQESMTDPSFAHQLITFTYPHIGNYGVSEDAGALDEPATGGRDGVEGRVGPEALLDVHHHDGGPLALEQAHAAPTTENVRWR